MNEGAGIAAKLGVQQLHRYRPGKLQVCGSPHVSDPAAGDTLVKPVPTRGPDGAADR